MKKNNSLILNDNIDYAQSHTRNEIAERFNLTYNQVNNWCRKYNIHPLRQRQEKFVVTEDFIEYAKTHTIGQIINNFHISYATILSACKRENIVPLKVKLKHISEHKGNLRRTGEAMDMIKTLIPVYTDASIARVFGYSKERIRQIRNEMGVEK